MNSDSGNRDMAGVKTLMKRTSLRWCCVAALCPAVALKAVALPIEPHVQSRPELEFGTVLFDYHQQDYFSALIEYDYHYAQKNREATQPTGRLLSGGMMLSYGMGREPEKIFNQLLQENTPEEVRNRAWYYLAKLYYNKSDPEKAYETLERIHGNISPELHFDYHYLATLIKSDGSHLSEERQAIDKIPEDFPQYPYLLFNFAISHLSVDELTPAVRYLEKVAYFNTKGEEELEVLSDRAKHGLAQLAMQTGHLARSWTYLSGVRTTGLYSNRALLSYAWAAIRLKKFNEAIPALEILDGRSIAIPEVQEGKVLLAHLYEQQGYPRKALKGNLLAEKEFNRGLRMLDEARQAIGKLDVPREFIANLEAIMDKSDWYGSKPSVDYMKLTPFLIDLMASNAFHETLKELADLYAMEKNLEHWLRQTREHKVVLENARQRNFQKEMKESVAKSEQFSQSLTEQSEELALYILTLNAEDQKRVTMLLDSAKKELALLESRVTNLVSLDSAYQQPASYQAMVEKNHRRIEQQLKVTRSYIKKLEPIMRNLVKDELNKHDDRMRYYLAQSRLAKARLYDSTLLSLERAQAPNKDDAGPASGTASGANK